MGGFFNTNTTAGAQAASELFFLANQAQIGSTNVQDAMDILFERVNRFPIITSTWNGGFVTPQDSTPPAPEEGNDGDYKVVADYPGGDYWPPILYQKIDGTWTALVSSVDYRFVNSVPSMDLLALPPRAWYADPETGIVTIYEGTIDSFTEPDNENILQYSTSTHRWEQVPLATAIANVGLQVMYVAIVTSYDSATGLLIVDINGNSYTSYVGENQAYQNGDELSVITLDGSFSVISNNSQNAGASLVDLPVIPGTQENIDYLKQVLALDKTNQTGRGHNNLYCTYYNTDDDELLVLSINTTSGYINQVSTITNTTGSNWSSPSLFLVGSSVFVWMNAGGTGNLQPLHVVLADNSTAYVGDYSNVSVMEVSGVQYIVVSDDTTGDWWYYNEDGSVNGTDTLPASANALICNKGWMWTNKGDVAVASLTPSFTSYHNVTLSINGVAQQRKFAITPDNGHLWRASQSGSPLHYNLTEYSSTVNNSTTSHNHIFASTTEPLDITLSGADGVLAIAGIWNEKVAGGTVDPAGAIVWSYDGTTLTELVTTPEAASDPYPMVGIAPTVGRIGVLYGEGEGSLQAITYLVARQVAY